MASETVEAYAELMEQKRAERKAIEMLLSAKYDTSMDAYVSWRRCDETGQLRPVWYDWDGSVLDNAMVQKRIKDRFPSGFNRWRHEDGGY